MTELTGKVAFVTGAATGIGYAIARALLDDGIRVMLSDINNGALAAAESELSAFGEVAGVKCNVSSAEAVQAAAEHTIERFGAVHVLANTAGVSLTGAAGEIEIQDWQWIVDINVMGTVRCVEAFLPHIKAHGQGGFIINTASMAGLCASAGMGPYNATKFAVVGYSESLRAELAPHKIGVAALCPSWSGVQKQHSYADEEMSPAAIAQLTIECIKRDASHVFTDPDTELLLDARRQMIEGALDACLDKLSATTLN